MLKTELEAHLSPSFRLSQMAAPPPGPSDASGKMSIGAARQHANGAAKRPLRPGTGPVVSAASPALASIQAGANTQRGAASHHSEDTGAANTSLSIPEPSEPNRELVASLARLEERVAAISTSVEFTEAYVSAGITNKLGEMLTKELAIAERAAKERMALQRRLKAMGFMILILVGILAAEIRYDFLSEYLTQTLAWTQTATRELLVASEPFWSSLTQWIGTIV